MESAYRCLKIAGQIAALGTLFLASGGSGQEVMRPVISEDISPLEAIAPVAADGHIGFGYLRKPPGEGPFPAVVFIHGGTLQRPPGGLRTHILGAGVSRFLEAGYVVSSITYRSREEPNTQTQPSLADTLAAVEFLRDQAYIDAESVVVNGCSGGGELALRMAGQTEFPLVIVEEPASVIMSDLVTSDIIEQYFSSELRDVVGWFRDAGGSEAFSDRVGRIRSPVLLVTGDLENGNNEFNSEILLPEMRSAGKEIDTLTFPGGHCFAFEGTAPSAQDAFLAIDARLKARINTPPVTIDSSVVTYRPASEPLERTAIVVSPDTLAEYAGDYQLPTGMQGLPPGIQTMRVTVEDNQLLIEIGEVGRFVFFAETESFFFSQQGLTMEFVRDDDGRVVGNHWGNGIWVPRLDGASR